MHARIGRTWTGLVAAGLAAAVWAAPAELPVAEVRLERVPVERLYEGQVEAVSRSTVSAQVTGRIEAIYFDVDDYVPKGAVILRFRDREFRARVAQARAALSEAEARLAQAEAEHARVRRIFVQRLVSRSVMDKAVAELKAARARLAAAKARLAEAEEQLANTVVRAPYAGIVVERHVEVGETARVGQPLMTGLSLERLRVTATVPQSVMPALRGGAAARVLLGPDREPVVPTRVTLFPYADTRAHTFRVRLELPPADRGLYPGMWVKVALRLAERELLVVPQRAVVHRSEVTAVYVVDRRGRIGFRQVRLGRRLPDGRVEVLSGLTAGERVALDPVRATARLKAQQGRTE